MHLNRNGKPRTVQCYAEGRDGDWEAICLDFDVAVQGSSFEDVLPLNEAIGLYLESVADLPESDRASLLSRSAPLSVRLKFLRYAIRSVLGGGEEGAYRHQFTMPLAA